MSKEEILETAKKRFKYCIEAETENRKSQIDDAKMYAASPDNGWGWSEEVRLERINDGGRPCLTINRLPQHVKQVTNEQRQNRPQIKIIPQDSGSDVEVAEIFEGVIRHIQVASNADLSYDTACEHQVVSGEGFWRVVGEFVDDDSFNQDLVIKRIKNALTVHMDPDISDPVGSDQRFCFITDDITEEEFEELYPKASKIDWTLVGQGEEYKNWFSKKKIRIAEYYYIEEAKKTLIALDNGYIGFKEDLKDFPDKLIKPIRSREVRVKQVKWCKLNGYEVLEERDIPGKYIPVVRVVGNETVVDGKPVISGLIRNAKDPQRMYNYLASTEIEALAMSPKAPFIAAHGQIEGFEKKWQNSNKKSFAVLEYNHMIEGGILVPAPQRQMPPQAQVGVITAKNEASDDIKAATGQYNASIGQQSNETSGIAIQKRQHEGDVSNFHYTDNLSYAIRHTGVILVDLIPIYYDESRIARILGEDGTADHVVVNPKQAEAIKSIEGPDGKELHKSVNFSIGKYDVSAVVGPSYTSKRQESAELMGQMLQGNPALLNIIGDLAFKSMDVTGAEEISERLKMVLLPEIKQSLQSEGQDPEVEQAKQALQQAMQHIQQMEDAMKQMAQGFEAAKADKARMDSVISAYKAETERIKVVAPAMTPEEIQAFIIQTMQGIMTNQDISPEANEVPQQQPQQPVPQGQQPQGM